MALLKSLVIAFSTYSKIPMPKIDWSAENQRYAVCFFPCIGVIIGALWLGWMYLAGTVWQTSELLRGAIATVIPILISGGIHLDGFCDITDAFSSWQPREKKLEILKDPHVGAFAIIGCGCYLLAYCGIMGELRGDALLITAFSFLLSRSLSALALVNFRSARPNGMLDTFSRSARQNVVTITSLLYLIVALAGMARVNLLLCLAAVLACLFSFWIYHYLAYQKLGGTTGDLAGWFLQVCELAIPYFVFICDCLL